MKNVGTAAVNLYQKFMGLQQCFLIYLSGSTINE
jgi:hypothetical protein